MTVNFSVSTATSFKISHKSHSALVVALRFKRFPEPTKLKSMLITISAFESSQSNCKLTGSAIESCEVRLQQT